MPSIRSRYSTPQAVQINTGKGPFTNLLAREALYYATDGPLIAKQLNDALVKSVQGFTTPNSLFYTPTVPGYRTYDLAKAKALVRRLHGLSFTLTGETPEAWKTEAEALQTRWEAAGMKVTLNLVTTVHPPVIGVADVWWQDAGYRR